MDPTPDGRNEITCESYEIVEGEASDDIIRLGVIEARPGEVVEVPIYLTNSVPVQATPSCKHSRSLSAGMRIRTEGSRSRIW